MYTPATIDLKIKIDGVDVTAYVPQAADGERGLQGISIKQVMGKAVDIAKLSLENAGALTITEWDEVIISNDAETVTYFGGHITTMVPRIRAGIEIDYKITCQDYTILFDKAIINKEWVSQTDTTILADIRTDASPDLTAFDFSTEVTSQGTIDRFRAPRRTVREALDELAKRAGAVWYVDYDKNLHWFGVEDVYASFGLSDSPDYSSSYPYAHLRKEVDGMSLINRVTVVGGRYLSANTTHEYASDGQQTLFTVPYYYHHQTGESAVLVDKNTGSDVSPSWTAQTLGIKYIDDGAGKDVLFSFQERFFEFATAPSDLKLGWRVRARHEAPLRVRVRSQDSYDRYSQWFEDVLVDYTILDKGEARKRGKAILAERALGRTVYYCSVHEPGLRAGEVVRLEDSTFNIDDYYLIQKITRFFLGGGNIVDELAMGDYLPDLYELMVEVAKTAAEKVEWRDDEVLDELLEMAESLAMTEGGFAVTPSGIPYLNTEGTVRLTTEAGDELSLERN
jgi:hypothetical protein